MQTPLNTLCHIDLENKKFCNFRNNIGTLIKHTCHDTQIRYKRKRDIYKLWCDHTMCFEKWHTYKIENNVFLSEFRRNLYVLLSSEAVCHKIAAEKGFYKCFLLLNLHLCDWFWIQTNGQPSKLRRLNRLELLNQSIFNRIRFLLVVTNSIK